MSKPQINYYLDNWTDEVVPCACTLQGWADWLSEPAPDWGRPEAAADGAEFAGSTLEVLGDVKVEWVDDGWKAVEPIPEGTTAYFLRWYEGSPGWNAEFSANTIPDACDLLEEDEGPLWFACVKDGPSIRLRFNLTADGPRLSVVAPVQ